jgi:hypothetical protein
MHICRSVTHTTVRLYDPPPEETTTASLCVRNQHSTVQYSNFGFVTLPYLPACLVFRFRLFVRPQPTSTFLLMALRLFFFWGGGVGREQ